jgi:hypothetical protein
MNVRKNGKIVNKTGWIRNKLLGKIVNVHSAFSLNSNGSDSTAPYLYAENTRKSMEVARLGAEQWRAEAGKLRLNIC